MNRKQFNIMLTVGVMVVIALIVLIQYINQSVKRHLSVQPPESQAEVLQGDSTAPIVQANEEARDIPQLDPDKLSSYQISSQRNNNLFKNQQYWDVTTKNALDESGILRDSSKSESFKKNKISLSQYKKQVKRIDGRIRAYKRHVQNNPNDIQAQKKLQNLYMLKSTIKALKESIVSAR